MKCLEFRKLGLTKDRSLNPIQEVVEDIETDLRILIFLQEVVRQEIFISS